MADEEYEILPHQLLIDLKEEVEALKKKLIQPDAKANELILEIESMKDAVHELTLLFQKALEQGREDDMGASLKTLFEKLDMVVRQNETIAKGMLAIADKLEDFMAVPGQAASPASAASAAMPQLVRHTIGMPAMRGPRVAPPLMMPSMEPSMGFTASRPEESDFPPPPPAPGKDKKKLISGLFK